MTRVMIDVHAYRILPSFEVNVGIVAACTPVLKPFFRYIKARVTGKDPHDIVRQSTTQYSFHFSWSRIWPSRSDPNKSQQGRRNGFHRAPPNSAAKNVSHVTDVTLSLPLQGIGDSGDAERLSPQVPGYDFNSSSQIQFSDIKTVEDRV